LGDDKIALTVVLPHVSK